MALSTIGEGCKRHMEPIIHDIIANLVLPSITDPVIFNLINFSYIKFKF